MLSEISQRGLHSKTTQVFVKFQRPSQYEAKDLETEREVPTFLPFSFPFLFFYYLKLYYEK